MALPLQEMNRFPWFPWFVQKQVFVASACRPKPKASKEKTEEQLVMSPGCNNFWCCALSLFCLVSPALQALSYLVNVNAFIFSYFSCFQFSTFFDMFSFCSFTIILWRTPFPCALRSLKPFVCFTFCKLFTCFELFICCSSETRPMRSRWTLLFRPGG